MTEATHFSQCVHDQQRRLEAEDCDSIRCAQLISGGRRRIRPPCRVPRSRSPTMRCIRLVGASLSEPHIDRTSGRSIYVTISRKRDHLSHVTKFHIYLPADSAQHAL